MNRLNFFAIVLLALLLTLTGCNKEARREKLQKKLRIESVEGVSGSMAEGWVIRLRVKNMTGYSPTITSGKGSVYIGDSKVANVALREPVRVPKRVESAEVELPVALSLTNPLTALALVGAVRKGNYDGIDISFEAQINVMTANRTIKVERMPLKDFLKTVTGH